MSIAKVFDGKEWLNVEDKMVRGAKGPVPPVVDGDGRIFVVMPSFRDGKRCAATVTSIFKNAIDPDKVVIGLIEQNNPQDPFCLEEYCSFHGVNKYIKRQTVRKDMIKVSEETGRDSCPRLDQIRLLAFHDLAAKGPAFARSMTRKILGDEEFCLQIDSHTQFSKGWDQIAKEEWLMAGNEFAILSTTPVDMAQQSEYEEGSKRHEVPRQCLVDFLDVGIPLFKSPGDGRAVHLKKPLLSHTWSAGFSFSKCHLEESAPHDPHASYLMHAEQFARFARFWTRGYDVYTPTRNFVFHDYRPHPDGYGVNTWFHKRRERHRAAAILRIKSFLQMPDIDSSEVSQANLGIYGLGKRRTLKQLADFVGIDLHQRKGNNQNLNCANLDWVWYDSSVSPVENLFSNPDDLDFQPEYPLRTSLSYYKQEQRSFDLLSENTAKGIQAEFLHQKYPFPSSKILVSLWLFGLIVWCYVFLKPADNSGQKQPKRNVKKKSIKDV